jgi:PilZ domain
VEVCRQRALLVGLPAGAAEQVRGALEPLALEVSEALDGRHALAVAPRRRIDGLIVSYPLPDGPMSAFVRAVRTPGSPLRSSGLVVVTPRRSRDAVRPLVGRGANRVVDMEDVSATLPGAVDHVLGVAPRVRITTPVRFEARGLGSVRRVFGDTVNLSVSGMLVRMPYRLPIGTPLRFELFLGGGLPPVRGMATLVRHTVPDHETHRGIALAFSDLEGADAERLASHLARLLQ